MLDIRHIDQMIEALLAGNREQAVFLVQECTGSTRRQALEVVLAMLEELDSTELWPGELVRL